MSLPPSSPIPTTTTTTTATTTVTGGGIPEPNKAVIILKQKAAALQPIFPEAMILHYLEQSGCQVAENEVTRLVSQQLMDFVESVVTECISISNQSKRKSASLPTAKKQRLEPTTATTSESAARLEAVDLEEALKQHKFAVSRAPYFAL